MNAVADGGASCDVVVLAAQGLPQFLRGFHYAFTVKRTVHERLGGQTVCGNMHESETLMTNFQKMRTSSLQCKSKVSKKHFELLQLYIVLGHASIPDFN